MEREIRGQVFRLLDLPSELIDNILGHVPLHCDLLNFALASRLCSAVAIPRHTEYRVVHFEDDDTDAIWTHLARRSDLASNIREIQVIYDEAPNEFLWGTAHIHIPHGLFDMDLDFESETAEEFQQDILNVLGAMTRLEKVHWNWVPKRSKHLVQKVFDVLKTIPTLKHLSFNHPKKFSPDVTLEKHPLWSITGLESLSIQGSTWRYLSRIDTSKPLLLKWLRSLPSLQFLRIDTELILTYSNDLTFPHLRGLDLRGETTEEDDIVVFLQRHPSIEELSLPLKRLLEVPDHFLPNLKHLSCHPAALLDLEAYSKRRASAGQACWHLEYLQLPTSYWRVFEGHGRTFVDSLCDFTCFDHTALRVLSLEKCGGSISSFIKLAKVFPMIEELEISLWLFRPNRKMMLECTFLDTLFIFPHFPNLRVIHGCSIWADLRLEDLSRLSSEECSRRFIHSPMDPVTSFALNACTDPDGLFHGKLYSEEAEWTNITEVNHRVLALAKKCKKLERVDTPFNSHRVIWIRRKKVNWGNVKAMADWLRIGKEKVDAEWEEIEYSAEERCTRNPFETIPKKYADSI